MYILTFKRKKLDLFGSIGVFEDLKEIEKRIKDLQSDNINGIFYTLKREYERLETVKFDDLLDVLKYEAFHYCSFDIEGDNHIFNIRMQEDIKKIK